MSQDTISVLEEVKRSLKEISEYRHGSLTRPSIKSYHACWRIEYCFSSRGGGVSAPQDEQSASSAQLMRQSPQTDEKCCDGTKYRPHPELPTGGADQLRHTVFSPIVGQPGILFLLSYLQGGQKRALSTWSGWGWHARFTHQCFHMPDDPFARPAVA
jgi:hypothetical protein